MAHNKLYRNFIILQEDERGCSHSNDKALSGYAKIEAKGDKCKISFYAQNLKQEDNYSMVLICCKRDLKQLIDIGPLAINDVGKADASKEYYVNNIAGLGISYEKISGAAICKVQNNENEFVMHGFMNGEDSLDNWRKFKFVRVDSKNYASKLDSEPKRKEISSLNATTTQYDNTENKTSKAHKVESKLIDSKKDEGNFQVKENIELGNLNGSGFKIEDEQNRIPEKCPNSFGNIEPLDDGRCKEKYDKESHKCHKCEKHDDFQESMGDVEEYINKLSNKLEDDDGIIDIKIDHHMHEEVIVYGFIKDKKKYGCKWKKFKLEKKCRDDSQDSSYYQISPRRIDENFNLDRLNEFTKEDRMDIIDFDKYEKGIKPTEAMKQASTPTPVNTITPTVAETNIPKITLHEAEATPMVSESPTPTVGETSASIKPAETTIPATVTPEKPMSCNICSIMGQQGVSETVPLQTTEYEKQTPKQTFNLIGSIGKYFEKLAEGFKVHNGSLNDINYCKWYKVNIKSIDDLSDESNYNKYTLAFYPMLNYYPYISKIGHFLLGYKCNPNGEMKYIIYAIPGSKEKTDQPYGGRTGFVTWTSDNSTGLGYWLMFYDFKNSSIVIPTK